MTKFVGAEYFVANMLIEEKGKGKSYVSFEKLGKCGIYVQEKFIEANMIFKYLQQKPIVLLDDVFSELDHERRNCLVKNFKDHQVIITSVENIELPIS